MIAHEGQYASLSRNRLGPDRAQGRADRQFARAHSVRASSLPLLASAVFFLVLASMCFVVAVDVWNTASFLFVGMGCLPLWGAVESLRETR